MLEVETSQLVTCFLVIHIFQVWILFEDGLCHFRIIFTDHFAADTDPFPVLSSGGYLYMRVFERLLINTLVFPDVEPEFILEQRDNTSRSYPRHFSVDRCYVVGLVRAQEIIGQD